MQTPPERILTHAHHRRRRTRRQLTLIGIATAIITLLFATRGVEVPLPNIEIPNPILNSQPGLYPVVHINDGDTIIVKTPTGDETIRLLGVDTPETKDPRKPVQCFGEAASAHTKQRLTGQSVRLEPDPTNSDRDKYGRLLRYVYLPDGTLYNAELIQDGYGFAYTVFPLVKLDDFKALEHDAREANRGLWAGCNINESSQIKQTVNK